MYEMLLKIIEYTAFEKSLGQKSNLKYKKRTKLVFW